LISVGLAWFWLRTSVERHADLSSRPPAEIFEWVFNIAPPAGVRELRVAGYAPFGGDVWMRFRADDVHSVLQALKNNSGKPLAGPDGEYKVDWLIQSPFPESRQRARSVGWEGISRIKAPEYYRFPEPCDSGWNGMIVVDRERKLIFVAAGL
jgi:hypothetical protein